MNFKAIATGFVVTVVIYIVLRLVTRRIGSSDHGSVPMNADRVDRFNKLGRHD